MIDTPQIRHPAQYSKELLPILCNALEGYERVLDPFAGTGVRLLTIRPDAYLNEIEPRWAAISQALTERSFVGDATCLQWPDSHFDAIVTSCTYANRMADHHEAKDASRRNTYRHCLGEPLQPNNSGAMQWGEDYRLLHMQAWRECYRVLRPGGRIVVNVKDHYRKGQLVEVSAWHVDALGVLGFAFVEYRTVETPGQRHGANGKLRVPFECILVFEKPEA